MIGSRGTVTVATRGKDGPGEVELQLGGGTATFIAYSQRPISRGTLVVVYDARGGRRVDIETLNGQED